MGATIEWGVESQEIKKSTTKKPKFGQNQITTEQNIGSGGLSVTLNLKIRILRESVWPIDHKHF